MPCPFPFVPVALAVARAATSGATGSTPEEVRHHQGVAEGGGVEPLPAMDTTVFNSSVERHTVMREAVSVGDGRVGVVKRVVQVKLLPDAAQAQALRVTLHACNRAANQVSEVARARNIRNKRTCRRSPMA